MKKNVIKHLKNWLLLTVCVLSVVIAGCGNTPTSTPSTEVDNTAIEHTDEAVSIESETSTTETPETSDIVEEAQPADYNILFIGNSFTQYNNMPKLFLAITEAAEMNVAVDSCTKGSWTLLKFSSPEDTYGKQAIAKLAENKYDYVIIQEQSSAPIKKPGHFYDGVRNMYSLISENGATPVLYETWGYNSGYLTLDSYGQDTAEMEMKLRAAYTAIGEELSIDVSYVGTAMTDVLTNYPDVNLYNSDHKHPSYNGSTLAALTLFADIFDTDPRTVAYSDETIDKETMNILKEAAYHAAFDEIIIDEDKKTFSEGIVTTSDEE